MENQIPESNKAVRVQELAIAARHFKARGNYIAMANMLERIAKEMGNVYSNRREFTGKDRGPIKYQDIETMTDEQIDQELKQILGIKDADVHKAPGSEQ